MFIYLSLYVHMYVYLSEYICLYIYIYIYIYIFIYIYIYKYVYVYIYTHIYTVYDGWIIIIWNDLFRICFLFISYFIYCTVNMSQLDTVFEVSSTMISSTSPEFGNSMLYWLSSTPEATIRRFQCLGVNLRTDSALYWWKPNTQSTSWCSGWSRAIMALCHSSSHMVSDSTRRPISTV